MPVMDERLCDWMERTKVFRVVNAYGCFSQIFIMTPGRSMKTALRPGWELMKMTTLMFFDFSEFS